MSQISSGGSGRRFALLAAVLGAAGALTFGAAARAQEPANPIVQISVDRFTNSDSVHKTEVEPDFFAYGSTIVGTFHVGRRPGSIGWGSADIGFATSTDGGGTWQNGYLKGTVNYQNGKFGATADPSVAYDAKHGIWIISSLPLVGLNSFSDKIGDVGVNRSSDGGLHWSNLIAVDSTALDDKNWTVCDNTATSPYYGNCYTEWDQAYGSGDVLMSVSSDGGKTWGPGKASSDHAGGLGGEPVVQPNGTVVVPFEGGGIDAFVSTDGGNTWGHSVTVASIDSHYDGDIRNPNLPSAAIDGAGNVYVAWSDCRFRSGCAENDIVYSSSADGTHWSAVTRVPIDPTNSTVDHFLPGIGIDPNTSGTSAHLTVVYYYFPVANCSGSGCQLDVGFSSSTDGGATWSAGAQLAGPMQLSWLPDSDNGPMVADYIAATYSNGNAFGIFAVAKAPNGSLLNEAMYTTRNPLAPGPDAMYYSSRYDTPVPGAKSDHEMKFYYDDEGTRQIPPERLVTRPQP